MKKSYVKLIAILCCIVLCGSCSSYIDEFESSLDQVEQVLTRTSTISFDSIDSVVYNESLESWMVSQKDPYRLDNFQLAYDNLVSGNTLLILTESQVEELASTVELEATHYALKIFPRDESEQWLVERMEDVNVSHFPFDYRLISEEQCSEISQAAVSTPMLFEEEVRYQVIYDDLMSSDGFVEADTIVMPTLYVVWPSEKPLPEELDYELDYEVYIPPQLNEVTQVRSASSVSDDEVFRLLEDEAIQLAVGRYPTRPNALTRSTTYTVTGSMASYDDVVSSFVPLVNLKIRFQLGTNIYDTYTLSNGTFTSSSSITDETLFTYIFQHERWKLTSESSTSPFYSPMVEVGDLWWNSTNIDLDVSTYMPYIETHRAVNSYYNDTHPIQKWWYSDGIRIRMSEEVSDARPVTNHAYFTCASSGSAYITVLKRDIDQSIIIGAVFHELGHFIMYGERGGYTGYIAVHKLLRESYASYVGWYLGELYYTNLGWVKPSLASNITRQSRQDWVKTNGASFVYSPMFVDLFDNYNQYSYNNTLNPDPIYGFSHIVMKTIAAQCEDWDDVKVILSQYINTAYYSESEFNSYIVPYDYWWSVNVD